MSKWYRQDSSQGLALSLETQACISAAPWCYQSGTMAPREGAWRGDSKEASLESVTEYSPMSVAETVSVERLKRMGNKRVYFSK